jgi:hypothetical protein
LDREMEEGCNAGLNDIMRTTGVNQDSKGVTMNCGNETQSSWGGLAGHGL